MFDVLSVAGVSARAFGLLVTLPMGDALSMLPRLLIAVCFAMSVAPSLTSPGTLALPSTPGATMLGFEFLTGMLLALPAKFLTEAAEMLGEVLDTTRGQTIGSVVDPLNGQAVSDMATLLRLGVLVLVVSLGGIDSCVKELTGSFLAIPVGGVALTAAPLEDVIRRGVSAVTGALSIGSVWLLGYLMVDIGTAVLAKVVQGMYFTSTATVVKMVLTFILLATILDRPRTVVSFVSRHISTPIMLTSASGAGSSDPVLVHE